MAFSYLYYSFAKKAINNLESKYLENFQIDNSKIFLYSNTIDISSLCNLTKIRKKSYDLYELLNTKQDYFLLQLVYEAKRNKFYQNNVLFLYSIASSIVLKRYLNNITMLTNCSSEFDYNYAYYSDQVDISKNNICKLFPNAFLYSFTELDYIKNSLTNTYFLPMTDRILHNSLNQYKKILNGSIFSRPKFFFTDLISNKKNIKIKDFKYNKYKPNEELLHVKFNESLIHFDKVIQKALFEASELLDAINQALYFDKEKPLILFCEQYQWNSIKQYYEYIELRKKDEKERNKEYENERNKIKK